MLIESFKRDILLLYLYTCLINRGIECNITKTKSLKLSTKRGKPAKRIVVSKETKLNPQLNQMLDFSEGVDYVKLISNSFLSKKLERYVIFINNISIVILEPKKVSEFIV